MVWSGVNFISIVNMMSASSLGHCVGSNGAVGATVAGALQFFAAAQCLLTEPWPSHYQPIDESRFDFIIVGGGTAGALIASRLSEVNATVLLVEAGGDPPQESIVPGFRKELKGSPFDWNFTTQNDLYSSQALQGGSQRQPRGKMLGGSSSLNDMIYARGFPVDYHEWASIVGDLWDWNPVLEAFKKTEHLTDENIINNPELMKYHGRDGEIEVAGLKESTHETDRFLDAFRELGFNIVDDMTYPLTIGAGRLSQTIRDGRRDGPVPGLLNKAAKRNNLYVLKNAQVTKILIQQKLAYGVEVLINHETFKFYVNKEVIISAGTFNTAKLLLLSGIGPKEHLEEMGIQIEADLPAGKNLHDHVMVLTFLAADNGTCYNNEGNMYMDMIKYLHDRTGMFSYSNSMGAYVPLGGLTTNVPEFAIYPVCMPKESNLYVPCTTWLGFKHEICAILDAKNKEYELLSLAVVLLKPQSRGEVRLQSVNPLDDPLIYSGTFSDHNDLVNYPDIMNIAYSVANTSYFKDKRAHVVDLNIEQCRGISGRELLECTARAMAMSAWHAVGTAAMGSVVDERLKVRGIAGLRVADASVMPKVIRANTNAPVVMIAERAADFIKEDHGGFHRL